MIYAYGIQIYCGLNMEPFFFNENRIDILLFST
jgi:hypothetical protein